MSRQLPPRPNLEHLRNQAKALLADLQRRNTGSRLADALHALAREYGFSSWPKLKAHVESLSREQPNPFVGSWTVNLSRSRPHPANQFRRATLQFAVDGDTVTIIDVVVDASAREEQVRNTIQVDGRDHPTEHGYVLTARWRGSHVLEALTKKEGQIVGRVRYEIANDDRTLTISAASRAHDDYPAAEQLIVLDRG